MKTPLSGQRVLTTAGKTLTGILATCALLLGSPVHAADLYWSGDGITEGGAGSWNTTGATNFSSSAAGPFDTVWAGAEGDNAIFEGTGGLVSLSGAVALKGTMFVKSQGYIFTNGLSIGTVGATNDTASGVTNTIGGIISGAGSLTKNGAGVMILNAVNTYTGGTYLNAGTLGWGGSTTTIGNNSAGVKIIINADNVVFANSSTAAKSPQQAVDQLGDLICDDSLITNPASLNFTGAQGPWTMIGADRKITVNGAASLILTAPLKDDGTARTLTKAGGGKLTLSNNGNSYAGKTIINGGTLTFGTIDTRLGVPPSGAPVADQLQINGGTMQITASVTLDNNRGITIGTNNGTMDITGTLTYGGVITGPGRLIRSGVTTGTLALSGANTYAGGTTINAGKISVSNNSALGSGTVTVASTGSSSQQLILNTSGLNISNPLVISGNGGVSAQGILFNNIVAGSSTYSGPITINGSASTGGHFASTNTGLGELILAGPVTSSVLVTMRNGLVTFANASNSFSSMSIQGGTCKLGLANALPTAASVDMAANGAATIELNGFDQTLAGLTKSATANTANVINSGAGTPTLTVNTSTTNNYGGVLGGTGNNFNLVKSGTGILTLGGANTYTGTTLVSGGTLKATNITGSATSSGTVTVASAGTLAGNGTVSGLVQVNGTIAPGDGVGTLSTGSETWAGGGHFAMEINQAAGTAGATNGWDMANITGGLTVSATSGSKFTVDLISSALSDFVPTNSYSWSIAHTTTGITGFTAAAFAVNTAGFTNSFSGSFSVTNNATDILVVFTPQQQTAQAPTSFTTTSAGHGTFSGTPGATYRVQYADALGNPTSWFLLNSVTTDSNGMGTFADPAAPSVATNRFYRIIYP